MQDIETRVQSVFRKTFRNDSLMIKREMTAVDIDGWDSLTHIHLMVALEKEFGVKIKSTDAIGLKNIGEMIDLVKSKIGIPR